MTAKRGKARGYLSQIAEPVPQGESVFSARRDLSAPSAHMQPPIPVIEGVIVSHKSRPARIAAETAKPASAPLPASDTAAVHSATRRDHGSESVLTADYVRPSSSRNIAEHLKRGDKRYINANSNEGPRNSELKEIRPATDRHQTLSFRESGIKAQAEHSFEGNPPRGAIIPTKKASDAPFLAAASSDRPAQHETVGSESVPSVTSVRSLSPESAQNFGAHIPDAKVRSTPINLFNNQETSGDRDGSANHKSIKSGASVVIGTLEIRTRISQPAPIPAPSLQRTPDRNWSQANLDLEARPERLDLLVRGLGWNFGLIQG
jgi:hypothetical protein